VFLLEKGRKDKQRKACPMSPTNDVHCNVYHLKSKV